MGVTDDPNDPRIVRGSDDGEPTEQHEVYLVLSEEERKKRFVRPYRDAYYHTECPSFPPEKYNAASLKRFAVTTMGRALSETYARVPSFYGATYCVHCKMHKPVGEFRWLDDGKVVGS